MATDYRCSHTASEKGKAYHKSFLKLPYRNMVWQLEKDTLNSILARYFYNTEILHLDFACGTGRILSYLVNRTKKSTGVDLSLSMLNVARDNINGAEIIEADLTRNDILEGYKFNLITAFRFFPNAEDELRMEAMQVLSRHLDVNGHIVFNNHKNTGSSINRLARFTRRQNYQDYRGMNMAEVMALLDANHLELVKVYHLCVLPSTEKYRLLPLFLLRPVETLLSKCSPLCSLGENLIFVCRKTARKSLSF